MNVQTSLNTGGSWNSSAIDFYSIDYCNYKTVNLFCSTDVSGCVLNILTSQDVNESFKIILQKHFDFTYNTTFKIVSRFMKINVQNASSSTQNITVHCKFEIEDKLVLLADANGTPISSDNPLQIFNASPPAIHIFDSNGEGIRSNANTGALYAQISDSNGGSILANNGSVNCNVTNSFPLHTSLYDSAYNGLTSSSGALNVSVANPTPIQASLYDSTNNGITSTSGALNVNVTNQFSSSNVLHSPNGPPLATSSYAGECLVVDINSAPDSNCYIRNQPNVNVYDSYGAVIDATNPLHVVDSRHLSTATDSVVAILGDANGQYIGFSNNNLNVALFDNNGNNLTVNGSNGGLNVNVANGRFDINLYDSNGTPVTSLDGKLSVQQNNLSAITDTVQANLYSSDGISLNQTNNALNVYNTRHLDTATDSVVTIIGDASGNFVDVSSNKLVVWVDNQQNNNIFDSSGNSITSTNNALNVFTTNSNPLNYLTDSVVAVVVDSSGNSICSTDNALNVFSTNTHNLDASTDSVRATISDVSGNTVDVSGNNLCVWVQNQSSQQGSNVFDSFGNPVVSFNSALSVFNTSRLNVGFDSVRAVFGNPNDGEWLDVSGNTLCVAVSNQPKVNMCASNGDVLTATDGKLNVNQNNLNSTTDSIQSNVCDSSGNGILSTSGALNVKPPHLDSSSDTVKAFLCDGQGNSLSSWNNVLNVNQLRLTATTDNIKAYIADGAYSVASTRGALNTTDFMTSLALGQFSSNYMTYRKVLGYRSVVDISGEDVTTLTATTYNFGALPNTGIGLYVNSTSINDHSNGGGGAQQVQLVVEATSLTTGTQTITLDLSGTANVATTQTNIRRILSMNVSAAGTSNTNVGTINCYTVGTSVQVANILPNNSNGSQIGVYSTYAYSALIKKIYYQCSNPCNIFIKYKPFTSGSWLLADCLMNASGNGEKEVLLSIGGLTDVKVYAVAISASATVAFQLDVIELV